MTSLRIIAPVGAGLLAMSGFAQASSIVFVSASSSTPSIVRIAAIEPGKLSEAHSLIALGEPEPAVTDEKVAAIPEHPETPMIIRGGIVGGAFATPAPKAAAKTTTPGTTTPETTTPGTTTPAATAPTAAAPANGTAPATATPPNGLASTPPNGNAAPGKTANASNGASRQPQKPANQTSSGKTM